MKIKIHNLTAFFVVALSVVLLGAVDAGIINKWFVMGEQTISSANPSVEIKKTHRESMEERRQEGKALCRGR